MGSRPPENKDENHPASQRMHVPLGPTHGIIVFKAAVELQSLWICWEKVVIYFLGLLKMHPLPECLQATVQKYIFKGWEFN